MNNINSDNEYSNTDNEDILSNEEDIISNEEDEPLIEKKPLRAKLEDHKPTKKERKPLVGKRITIEKPNNLTIIECTREVKKILSDFSYDIDKFIKKYEYHKKKYGLDEDDINNICDLFENKINHIEDEINLNFDITNGNIPESLYNYTENYLDRMTSRVEHKLLK